MMPFTARWLVGVYLKPHKDAGSWIRRRSGYEEEELRLEKHRDSYFN